MLPDHAVRRRPLRNVELCVLSSRPGVSFIRTNRVLRRPDRTFRFFKNRIRESHVLAGTRNMHEGRRIPVVNSERRILDAVPNFKAVYRLFRRIVDDDNIVVSLVRRINAEDAALAAEFLNSKLPDAAFFSLIRSAD